ncbi:MAG TPA: MBL fold metallo-hydrolase [Candidatus Paceibacterota bacterium]|jgi:metallo-beta-lactamase family protein
MQFQLSFHGGAGEVTGANFLLKRTDGGTPSILIDCGLVQGARFCDECNSKPFPYKPQEIDYLFITHAHADHIGRVPFLIKRGFKGTILSTLATRDIAEVMLADSLKIIQEEAARAGTKPLYEAADVARALTLWQTHPYHEVVKLPGDLSARFLDAGHILGSAMIELTSATGRKIVFTGDLGNTPAPLLQPIEELSDVTYLVMESVYGDRVHEAVPERTARLREVVARTINERGVLLIPAFSIERTQTLLYELNNLIESGMLSRVPVFLDSPLAIRVTDVYRRHTKELSDGAQTAAKDGDDIFNFPGLQFTETVEASKAINMVPPPKIIIAGAGMGHGGRILHHERRYLADPSTTLLLVGYQVVGSLGRRLLDGVKNVVIHGDPISVRARVESIRGYSSHCDRDCLISVVEHTAPTLEKVFVAMGEPRSSLALVQRLRDFLDVDAVAPRQGEEAIIEL